VTSMGENGDSRFAFDTAWDCGILHTCHEWPGSLSQGDRAASAMRLHTQTGRPLGGLPLPEQLGAPWGRRLRALPVGRPRKTRENRRGR
jgi:hypothetical protein